MGEFLRKALDEDLALSFQSARELVARFVEQFGLAFQFGAGRGDARNGLLALPEAVTMRNRKPKCRSNPASNDGRSLILRKVSFQNNKTPPCYQGGVRVLGDFS
ncbi:MAG TPA: hypothetical protein DD422_00210 [Akkermansia sp.]|nr:hypothetical protein [Akkermansia sp.]